MSDARDFIAKRYAEDKPGARAIDRLRQIDKDPSNWRSLEPGEIRALIDRLEAYENDLYTNHSFLRMLVQSGAETAQLAALSGPLRADAPCVVRARMLIDKVTRIILPLSA